MLTKARPREHYHNQIPCLRTTDSQTATFKVYTSIYRLWPLYTGTLQVILSARIRLVYIYTHAAPEVDVITT